MMVDIEANVLTTIEKRRLRATRRPNDEFVGVLKALADTNRLRIIDLLRQGEVCVCEMVDALCLPQNLVSHHLRVLREAGLVNARRDSDDSRWVYYSLNSQRLTALRGQLGQFLDPGAIRARLPFCGTPLGLEGKSPARRCE